MRLTVGVLGIIGFSLLWGQAAPVLAEDPGQDVPPTQAVEVPSPDQGRIHRELGLLFYRQGRYPEAEDELRKAKTTLPQDPSLPYYLGLAAIRRGEFAQADARFQEALALDPAFEPVQMTRGVLAYNAGRYPDASAVFTSLISTHPDDRQALFYLSLTHVALGEPDRAQEAVERLRQQAPALAQAADGILLYHRGRYPEALAELSAAEGANPDLALLYYYEGLTFYATGKFDRVSPKMLRAKTLDPGLAPGALYYSGLAYAREGDVAEAREDLQTVMLLESESALGRSAKAFLLDIVKRERFGRPWELSFGLTPQYDTNVISQPNDKPLAADITRQSDSGMAIQIVAGHKLYRTDQWTVTTRYTFLQQIYQSLTKNNIQNNDLAVVGERKGPRLQWRFPYNVTYTYQENSAFVLAHTVAPTLTIAETRRLIGMIQVQAKSQDYLQASGNDRDGTNLLGGYTQTLLLAGGRANIRLGYTYDRDSTKGTDWVYSGQKGTVGLAGPLPLRVSLDLSGEYYRKDYENINAQFGVKRKDDTTTLSAGLTRDAWWAVSTSLRYVNIRSLSNLADYDYSRQMVTLTLQKKF